MSATSVRVTVRQVDPKKELSPGTSVRAMWYVEREGYPHWVYHDRHGEYCSIHGKSCESVRDVRRWLRAG